jgi:hypothetical protein
MKIIKTLTAVRTLAILGLIALAADGGMVQAEIGYGFINGNALLVLCQGNPAQRLECGGYVEGVSDALNDFGPCHYAEKNITQRQVEDVVVKALLANPANRHKAAAGLVASAIFDAWHCELR